MKRWALLTILLYAVCVAVLGIPIYFFLGEDGAEYVSILLYILGAGFNFDSSHSCYWFP